ncbi:conjugative transposon protein TraM [Zunongwangia sp.]|uniref:conjugative transposon protein TraM n=1 Tax=Zunongwangia sp. TaxID=1965325 RepID=UPI003AA7DF99
MKLEKKKIVMVLIVVSVVLFIVSYSIITFGKDEETNIDTHQIPLPNLGSDQKQYETKMEALESIKKEREINAPSVYDEELLDATGNYDPDLRDKEKRRMIDSIYSQGNIDYTNSTYRQEQSAPLPPASSQKDTLSKKIDKKEREAAAKEMGLEHQLFFASNPKENPNTLSQNTDRQLYVQVDGTQTIKQHYRLRMRLSRAALIDGKQVPKNMLLYGFVSFKPNRALLTIEHIKGRPVSFEAYNLADGSEGIYIENSFREEVRRQVIGDVVDELEVPGVPQVSGIKQLFRRSNRQVKVTVLNGYQLLLKIPQEHS